jgi:FdhD protein
VYTTGRISSEMLQKSARMGASAVISRTSPTGLSLRLADELGITVIGYARRTQFNVYTHTWRFQSEPASLYVNTEPACEFC